MEQSVLRDWEGMTKEQIMDCLLRKRDLQPTDDDSGTLNWDTANSDVEDEKKGEATSVPTPEAKVVAFCIGCKQEPGKYKCPACHELYCRIACFHLHKKSSCSKSKVPQAFKSMKDYNERDLVRDFGFISNIMEGYDKVKKRLGIIDTSLSKHQEMVRYKILSEHAHSEKNITIRWAPRFMERHRENISFYFTREKRIYWVFEVVAPLFLYGDTTLAEGSDTSPQIKKWVSVPSSEDQTLQEVLLKFPFQDNDALVFYGKDLSVVDDWDSEGIEVYIKNTYKKEEINENLKIDPDVLSQINQSVERVKLPLKSKVSEVICCLILEEFPTIYLVKKGQ